MVNGQTPVGRCLQGHILVAFSIDHVRHEHNTDGTFGTVATSLSYTVVYVHRPHSTNMIDFTDEQIAARELRNAAYHEAGHKILYERFGGAGDAVVWKNESENPEETAWFGQFRPRTCPEEMRKAALNSGFTAPELPANWKILVGMAGLLAEDILSGETDDAGAMADTLFFRISNGDGYAQHLRDALPNATFVAFTGTPVSSENRDTRAVFGEYIHVYDMQQAKEDGATVAIYFESRLAKLSLKAGDLPHIDAEVDELAEDEEESQQAKLKSRWAALEKVVGAEPRVAAVATDLVAHLDERNKAQNGKAMVVAMSREICVHLYDEIIKQRPDWHDPDPEKGAIKIVMTGSASDKALLRPHIYSGQVKKRLEKRFKDPADPLRIVIVRDMWLTGFDAPCVHTLYVDKPMKGHNLMQAIARVNRVFKDKQGGLVVDYIGIANELKSALKEYTASNGRGRPTVDAAEAYSVLAEKLDILRGMLHGYDYSGFLTGGHKCLAGAANHVLGAKDGKKRFADTALAMSKAFTLCCTLDEAKDVREEVAFLQAVKVILTKRELSDKKKTNEERELAIRQIISSAVVSEKVVDVFEAVGLERPNIGILDEAFLAEVRNLPERNLAVELLERLLEGEIKSRFASNVVQEKKFSEMLANVVTRYQNRAIETAQVIEELIDMAKKFHAAATRGEELGLTEDEIRFYDALANNESAVRELTDETLKKIAHELTENLRQNITVDWSERESVRARLRLMVKRILRKYKYPPDQQDSAVELVLQQAQVLGEAWS